MARDPYKYFRIEGRELLDELTRALLLVEKDASDQTLVTKLLRLAHTLKGAAHVVKQTAIAQLAHTFEDVLAPYRDRQQSIPEQTTTEAMNLLAQIGAKLNALQEPPQVDERQKSTARSVHPSPETVRVELEEIEALLAGLTEAGVQIAAIRAQANALQPMKELADVLVRQLPAYGTSGPSNAAPRIPAEQLSAALARTERVLTVALERTERETQQCLERASRLRLLPVDTVFTSLVRAGREAASSLGKQIVMETNCGGIRLDADVLTLLEDALLHVVRNAVAHGVEDPDTRRAAGKPPAGKLELMVERRGSRVAFVCRDDGRGIDLTAIRKAAVRKGAIPPADAESLRLQDAINLVLRGGVSTADALTGTSGRGIGLDIVRDAAERLKGEVSIDTAPGRGTTVEICVPASLTSISALAFQSGSVTACLPLDSVSRSLRINQNDIVASGANQSIPYQDHAIPFRALSEVLNHPCANADGHEPKIAIIVTGGGAQAAIGVERLLATRSLLVRPLPAIAAVEPFVAGASLDAEGNPLLVFDPAGLVATVRQSRVIAPSPEKSVLPVLVIDDSLTTRMVEQNILESAGYRVEMAGSAEEALRMAQGQRYGIFLVDIEMPGIDGFQFISRATHDPLLRDTPSILVSSRNSPADRLRGRELGARAFFAKDQFDQGQFLKTVAHLLE